MTNFEFYKEKILSITKDKKLIALVKGKPVPCDGSCLICNFHSGSICYQTFIEWLYEEYKPKYKLTKRERIFCEMVGCGWLARDKDDGLIGYYSHEPKKDRGDGYWWECSWHDGGRIIPLTADASFDFIKIEDEKPYSIEEMLTWEVEEDD